MKRLAGPRPAVAAEKVLNWAPGPVTPATVTRPFYPLLNKPVDRDTDLTVVGGRRAHAQGQAQYLIGQVLNTGGAQLVSSTGAGTATR